MHNFNGFDASKKLLGEAREAWGVLKCSLDLH